ncbi:outer membrane protein OmpK [Halomonas getboli]|uniref:outer membrane protein OmpK n=1 Tax=Halomonas getboli TaxID=2935862 RepID=UPI0020000232|nr:outer membrane protein OmpK [Halomonas getboli]MCK2183789.1 ion channel protein Tsx [Halomonas getboli]
MTISLAPRHSVSLAGLLLGATALPAAASDDAAATALTPQWSFANVSVNYLDWSDGTEERTSTNAAKGDFFYLELEGGVGFDWGEFYGFYDAENPHNDTAEEDGRDNRRSAAKVTSHIYLGESPFSLYFHVYDFRDYGYDSEEQDRVVGFGYRHTFANGLWFKPFIGKAWVESDGNSYSGENGYMAGWVLGYDFQAFGEAFSLTNWHEQTFERDDEYLRRNYVNGPAGELGTNGAVALWWHPIDEITTGVQYRYSNNKLGTAGEYQNAMIYTLKYNFL